MEIPKGINPKHLIKTIPSVLAILGTVNLTHADGGIDPIIDLQGRCLPDGRIGISLQAKGFERFYGDPAKLYLYAADLTKDRGYILVGYDSNSDTFTAGMNGGIGSIAGQGSIEFREGDIYSFMIRRGPKIEDKQPGSLPITEYAADASINVRCGDNTSSDNP